MSMDLMHLFLAERQLPPAYRTNVDVVAGLFEDRFFPITKSFQAFEIPPELRDPDHLAVPWGCGTLTAHATNSIIVGVPCGVSIRYLVERFRSFFQKPAKMMAFCDQYPDIADWTPDVSHYHLLHDPVPTPSEVRSPAKLHTVLHYLVLASLNGRVTWPYEAWFRCVAGVRDKSVFVRTQGVRGVGYMIELVTDVELTADADRVSGHYTVVDHMPE